MIITAWKCFRPACSARHVQHARIQESRPFAHARTVVQVGITEHYLGMRGTGPAEPDVRHCCNCGEAMTRKEIGIHL